MDERAVLDVREMDKSEEVKVKNPIVCNSVL